MKHIICLLVLLTCLTAKGYSQLYNIIPKTSNGQSKDFTPPSPTAASLGIFGQVPVSPYTGLPEISVPLHTITYKELSIPLGVSYHASGVKPDHFPGSVGMGWNFNGEWAITRIIQGRPDEGGEKEGSDELIEMDYNPTELSDWSSTEQLNYMLGRNVGFDNDVSNPDEYYFSFNGMSGKFYIDHTGKFQIKSSQDFHFTIEQTILSSKTFQMPLLDQNPSKPYNGPYEPNFTKEKVIYKFVITDRQGVKYVFGGTDESIEFSRRGSGYGESISEPEKAILPITWKLTSIESPNGYKIELTYKRGILVTKIGYSEVHKIIWNRPGEPTKGSIVPPVAKGEKSTLINTSVLDQIVTPKEKIIFTNSIASSQLAFPTQVSDVIYENEFVWYRDVRNADTENLFPNKIDKIVVFDNTQKRVKSFVLNYTDNESTRLKLLSVQFKGKSDSSIEQEYKFEYNPGGPVLPGYLSYKTDHYGYYNGKNIYNTSNDPSDYLSLQDNESAYNQSKEPDEYYAKAEILTKIIYPTKGYTIFEYEANRYGPYVKTWPFTVQEIIPLSQSNVITGGLRIKQITNYEKSGDLLTQKKYHYIKGFSQKDPIYPEPFSSGVLAYKPVYFESYSGEVTPPAYKPGWEDYFSGTIDFWKWSNNPIFPMGETRGNHVTYSEVAEENADGSFIVYKYKNHNNGYGDHPPVNQVSDHAGIKEFWKEEEGNSLDLERGQIVYKEYFDNEKNIIKRKVYEYNDDPLRFDNNVRVLSKTPNSIFAADIGSIRYTARLIYTYFPYLKRVTEDNYFSNGTVSNSVSYTYNSKNKLVKEILFKNSDGSLKESIFRYPEEMVELGSTEPYQEMVNRKMEGYLIEKEEQVNGVLKSLSVTEYKKDWPSNPNLILPVYEKFKFEDGPLEDRVQYFSYDNKGNLLGMAKDGGSRSYFIWGYNQSYPIAEVKNTGPSDIAYTSFEENDGCNFGNWRICSYAWILTTYAKTGDKSFFIDGATISKNGLSSTKTYIVSYWTRNDTHYSSIGGVVTKEASTDGWNLFRHKLSGVTSIQLTGTGYIDELRLYPVGALMTTFGYNPLVGLSYSSDQNNIPSIYKYDDFGRLKRLEDHEGKVIKEYRYNYKD